MCNRNAATIVREYTILIYVRVVTSSLRVLAVGYVGNTNINEPTGSDCC